MKKITEIKSRNLRNDRNSELVRRMKNGETLQSFDSHQSWYPPRPVIEKNQDAIRSLYGRAAKALKPENRSETVGSSAQSSSAMGDSKSKDTHLQLAD